MRVMLISGKAQHGKDTSAEYIRTHLMGAGVPYERILVTHYADLLKWVAKQYFKWNGAKDEAGRTLLQTIGQRVRQQTPDYWCNALWQIVGAFSEYWDYVLVPDVRYPNELLSALNMLGSEHTIEHIRVIRENFDNGLTEAQKNHESEIALDCCTPDRYIYNSQDLPYLSGVCKNIVEEITNDYICWNEQNS